MKATHLLFLIILTFFVGTVYGQKTSIDSAAIAAWPGLNNPYISNNGKYFLYTINNIPVGGATLVVRSTGKKGYEKKFPANSGEFTPDSKYAIISLIDDTLAIYNLQTGNTIKILGVASHTLSATGWLICMDKAVKGKLTVYDPASDHIQVLTGVTWYRFDPSGERLLFKRKISTDSIALNLFDPASARIQTLYRGMITGRPVFDDAGEKVAFITNNKDEGAKLYLYHVGNSSLQNLVDDHTAGIGENAILDRNSLLFFNNMGDRLFFSLKADSVPKSKPDYIKVNIWNYKDGVLRSRQRMYDQPEVSFRAVYNINRGNLVRIETPDRMIVADIDEQSYTSSFMIVEAPKGTDAKYRLKIGSPEPILYCLSLDNGNEVPIRTKVRYSMNQQIVPFSISLTGRYLLYFNLPQRTWYSYDTENDITKNIGKNIHSPLTDEHYADGPTLPSTFPAGIAGWTKGDSAVLINGTYDIWKVDPLGQRTPVNLTAGYGLKHHILFRLANWRTSKELPFVSSNELLLTAFNPLTKYSGFYKVNMSKSADPELLALGRFCNSYPPFKARDTALWVTGRCSTDEAPNYFITVDFKNFEPLTDLQPQKQYNWMTSELANYKLPNGRMSQGVLLKPENFDVKKKYPIIFQFYQQESNELYSYFSPDFNGGEIDPAYYVSRGYLVFLPDIHLKAREPGQSVVNSVESAVRYLEKTKPYIDSTKMAINGESWGGYEVNCLVTHTHNFAAAAECCGMSDLVSDYGSIVIYGNDEKGNYEGISGYYKLNATLWRRPDIYIKNSPVFSIDKVTTPLLIQHNKEDEAVLFSQGEELFTALWELGKPAWMLQYDDSGHGVSGEDAIDYTKRLGQFFDYYLKGAPPPVWMTRGVPAQLKGIDSGLEYDISGAKP